MKLGFHVSIEGGLSLAVGRATEAECDCFQIFSRSPRIWRMGRLDEAEMERFKCLRREAGLGPVVIHTPYLLNLCSDDRNLRDKSRRHLLSEMKRAHGLGIELVNTHVGSSRSGRREAARLLAGIAWVLERMPGQTKLLLENSAGPSGKLGSDLGALCEVVGQCPPRVGLCIDVAHAFQAGFDLRCQTGVDRMVQVVRKRAGIRRLKLLHLNDSKTNLGSGADRHAHIGKGKIGLGGFELICREKAFARVPGILETPKDELADDLRNIRTLRRLGG